MAQVVGADPGPHCRSLSSPPPPASNVPNRSTFACPYCGARNLDQQELVKHCVDSHRSDPNRVVSTGPRGLRAAPATPSRPPSAAGVPHLLGHALGRPQLQERQLPAAPAAQAQVLLRHLCGEPPPYSHRAPDGHWRAPTGRPWGQRPQWLGLAPLRALKPAEGQ